jgi:hypothetical protein
MVGSVVSNLQFVKVISICKSALETEGRKMGFRIDQEKTNYVKMSPTQTKRYHQSRGVDTFTYLGSVLDNGNKLDIRSKIMTANCTYSAHNELLISIAHKLQPNALLYYLKFKTIYSLSS